MRLSLLIVFLVVATWLLAACGVKSDPKPPKPKPSTTTSQLNAVPAREAV